LILAEVEKTISCLSFIQLVGDEMPHYVLVEIFNEIVFLYEKNMVL